VILFKPTVFKTTLIYLTIAAGAAYIIMVNSNAIVGPVLSWLAAVNIVLFLVMGKDKLTAKLKWKRTPEGTLLWLAVAGGFPGLFLASYMFNHKSTKEEFRKPMWFLFIVQLLAILYYVVSSFGG